MGVASLALFGSLARDEARAGSDADVLVTFSVPVTFDLFMDLKFFLEDLLGMPVDLGTAQSLRPRIRPAVEAEAIYVA